MRDLDGGSLLWMVIEHRSEIGEGHAALVLAPSEKTLGGGVPSDILGLLVVVWSRGGPRESSRHTLQLAVCPGATDFDDRRRGDDVGWLLTP